MSIIIPGTPACLKNIKHSIQMLKSGSGNCMKHKFKEQVIGNGESGNRRRGEVTIEK